MHCSYEMFEMVTNWSRLRISTCQTGWPLKYVWLPITSTQESERSFLRHFKWFSRWLVHLFFEGITLLQNGSKDISLFCQNWRTLQSILFEFHNVKREMNKFFEYYLLSRNILKSHNLLKRELVYEIIFSICMFPFSK